MKKIELHVHLDGSVRPSTVAELLGISDDEAKKNMIVSYDNKNLEEYLTKFDLPLKVMQTKSNLRRIAKELALDLVEDGVIYAEVRFAPFFHTKQGLSLNEVVSSVLEGIKEVKKIKINLILCMMRGASYEDNLKTILVAKEFLNNGVVGLDLAGDEHKYKTSSYKDLFLIAKKEKIPFTIHAGEADGAKSVMDAISFGAKRIGHGIRILDSDLAINEVIKNGITLEVCPTSNVDTKVVSSYENHPVKKMYDKKIKITINTDDRTVSNVTLSSEYKKLKTHFNFTRNDLLKMNLNAVDASFMSVEEKKKYIKILKDEKILFKKGKDL